MCAVCSFILKDMTTFLKFLCLYLCAVTGQTLFFIMRYEIKNVMNADKR